MSTILDLVTLVVQYDAEVKQLRAEYAKLKELHQKLVDEHEKLKSGMKLITHGRGLEPQIDAD